LSKLDTLFPALLLNLDSNDVPEPYLPSHESRRVTTLRVRVI